MRFTKNKNQTFKMKIEQNSPTGMCEKVLRITSKLITFILMMIIINHYCYHHFYHYRYCYYYHFIIMFIIIIIMLS